MFDLNKNGRLGIDELTSVFTEHNIELTDMARLIEIVDTDNDGTIELDEWIVAIKPRRPCRGTDVANYLSIEQKNLFQRAWLEQLASLFSLII